MSRVRQRSSLGYGHAIQILKVFTCHKMATCDCSSASLQIPSRLFLLQTKYKPRSSIVASSPVYSYRYVACAQSQSHLIKLNSYLLVDLMSEAVSKNNIRVSSIPVSDCTASGLSGLACPFSCI